MSSGATRREAVLTHSFTKDEGGRMKDDPGEAAPTCRFTKDEGGRMKDDPLAVVAEKPGHPSTFILHPSERSDRSSFHIHPSSFRRSRGQVILPRSSFILGAKPRSSFHVHPSSFKAAIPPPGRGGEPYC
jgi:hypothetical protein